MGCCQRRKELRRKRQRRKTRLKARRKLAMQGKK